MAEFRDSEQLYRCLGALFEKLLIHPVVQPKLRASNLVMRFEYKDPDAIITADCSKDYESDAEVGPVFFGDCEIKPTITFRLKSRVAHKFWLGEVNLLIAIAKRDIVVRGALHRVLTLLPAITPAYEIYPKVLEELGEQDLLSG
jgi:hypothetical protein